MILNPEDLKGMEQCDCNLWWGCILWRCMNPILVITLEHGSLCVVAVHRPGLECVCVSVPASSCVCLCPWIQPSSLASSGKQPVPTFASLNLNEQHTKTATLRIRLSVKKTHDGFFECTCVVKSLENCECQRVCMICINTNIVHLVSQQDQEAKRRRNMKKHRPASAGTTEKSTNIWSWGSSSRTKRQPKVISDSCSRQLTAVLQLYRHPLF
jgi:hypothetical protein